MRTHGKGELKKKLIALCQEHPEWSKPQLALALGTTRGSVKTAMALYRLNAPDGRRREVRSQTTLRNCKPKSQGFAKAYSRSSETLSPGATGSTSNGM